MSIFHSHLQGEITELDARKSDRPVGCLQVVLQALINLVPDITTVLETKELHWWLLSFGPEVEVVEPKSLRELMRKLVGISAKRYRN